MSHAMTLMIGEKAFVDVAPLWKRLESEKDLPPFQTYGWARAWLRHLGEGAEPWILLAGDPVAALLPLVLKRVRGVRVLGLLGEGVSDYLGLLPHDRGAEFAAAIGKRLSQETRRFDLLNFRGFHSTDGVRSELLEALGRPAAQRLYERCPHVDTSGDWKEYLGTRRKKFRANLKRAARRVEAHGEVEVAREAATPELFAEMLEVERESWKWEHGTAYLSAPAKYAFMQEVILEGRVRHELWTCRVAGVLAGFAVVFTDDRTRHYYLPSFRSRFTDAGTFLLGEIVRDSFESPFSEFDFLQGDESYKLAWATGEQAVHHLVAAGRGPVGWASLLVLRARWSLARSERLRQLNSSQLLGRLRRRVAN
jgi:CelD/BcsL family acetyltransferase involved in cellulose biosynthesis